MPTSRVLVYLTSARRVIIRAWKSFHGPGIDVVAELIMVHHTALAVTKSEQPSSQTASNADQLSHIHSRHHPRPNMFTQTMTLPSTKLAGVLKLSRNSIYGKLWRTHQTSSSMVSCRLSMITACHRVLPNVWETSGTADLVLETRLSFTGACRPCAGTFRQKPEFLSWDVTYVPNSLRAHPTLRLSRALM